MSARLNYVEFPAGDLDTARSFYERVFGWSLTQFSPSYAGTTSGDTDIGLWADLGKATNGPLPVIEVDDLEAAVDSVVRAGGKIVRPIFAFPGGRRFQFLDPSGNEVAAARSD